MASVEESQVDTDDVEKLKKEVFERGALIRTQKMRLEELEDLNAKNAANETSRNEELGKLKEELKMLQGETEVLKEAKGKLETELIEARKPKTESEHELAALDAMQKCSDLELELKTMAEQIEARNKEITQLKESRGDVPVVEGVEKVTENQLENALKRCSELEEEIKLLTSERALLHEKNDSNVDSTGSNQVETLKNEISNLNNALAVSNEELGRVTVNLKTVTDNLTTVEANFEAEKVKLEQVNTEHAAALLEYEQKCSSLTVTLAEKIELINRNAESIQAGIGHCDELEASKVELLNKFNSKCEELRAEKESALNILNSANNEIELAKSEASKFSKELSEKINIILNTEQEIRIHLEEKKQIQTEKDKVSNELSECLAKVANLESKIDEHNRVQAESSKKIKEANENALQLGKSLKEASVTISDGNERFKSAMNENKLAQKQIDNLLSRLKSAEKECLAAKNANKSTQEQLKVLEADKARLQNELKEQAQFRMMQKKLEVVPEETIKLKKLNEQMNQAFNAKLKDRQDIINQQAQEISLLKEMVRSNRKNKNATPERKNNSTNSFLPPISGAKHLLSPGLQDDDHFNLTMSQPIRSPNAFNSSPNSVFSSNHQLSPLPPVRENSYIPETLQSTPPTLPNGNVSHFARKVSNANYYRDPELPVAIENSKTVHALTNSPLPTIPNSMQVQFDSPSLPEKAKSFNDPVLSSRVESKREDDWDKSPLAKIQPGKEEVFVDNTIVQSNLNNDARFDDSLIDQSKTLDQTPVVNSSRLESKETNLQQAENTNQDASLAENGKLADDATAEENPIEDANQLNEIVQEKVNETDSNYENNDTIENNDNGENSHTNRDNTEVSKEEISNPQEASNVDEDLDLMSDR